MKPCRNVKTINEIIHHHELMAVAHNEQVKFHQERIEILKEYVHELTKPGFKQRSVFIKVGTTERAESFVISASDTYQDQNKGGRNDGLDKKLSVARKFRTS